ELDQVLLRRLDELAAHALGGVGVGIGDRHEGAHTGSSFGMGVAAGWRDGLVVPKRAAIRPWRRPRSLTVSAAASSSSSVVRTMQAPARITSARPGCRAGIVRRRSVLLV